MGDVGSQRRSSRASSGYRAARVRESQFLPLDWRHLTKNEIQQLHDEVTRLLEDGADLLTIETCLLAWSILTTGRRAAQLLSLSVRVITRRDAFDEREHGLFKVDGCWGWWLGAGAPAQQSGLKDRPGTRRWSPSVYLPATDAVVQLVDLCVQHRNRAAAGRLHVSAQPVALFTHAAETLEARLQSMLAERIGVGGPRARRATTTPEALGRWLPAAITLQPGGDIVPASMLSGRVGRVARTSGYYGSIAHDAVSALYRTAVEGVDRVSHVEPPPAHLVDRYIGDRLTPSDGAVRDIIARLAERLDVRGSLAERHRAITDYTVALLAFAFGHRGKGEMPAMWSIDPETGFCWIEDKLTAAGGQKRLAWTCDIAIRQLTIYHAYLKALRPLIDPDKTGRGDGCFNSPGLPVFDIVDGVPAERDAWDVLGRCVAAHGGLTRNAGRHWLRAQLVGKCSTETLHAFFGHGPVEDSSWDLHGALDPLVYRADIARVLDGVLGAAGWQPRGLISEPRGKR